MKVLFYDRVLKKELLIDGVLSADKRKVNYQGRSQFCWVCKRDYWTNTYPCKRFDLVCCSL